MRRSLLVSILLAPFAAPAAVWLLAIIGLVLHCARQACPDPHSAGAAAVLLFALTLFGYPVALVATVAILVPVWKLTAWRQWSRTNWILGFGLVGAAAGAIVMPIFLHALEPRGSTTLPPGSGFAAGCAVAMSFASLIGWPPAPG